VPGVGTPAGRAITMTAGIGLVTAVNIIGVRRAAWTVNVFTIAKVLPLLLLVAVGMTQMRGEVFATQAVAAPNWTEAILLLVFAYGGFESSVIAASETRDPKRDTAFALLVGMGAVTVIYCLVQLVVVGVLPHAAQSTTPIAAALQTLLGTAGATIGSLAVVVSAYGWLTGFALMTPRVLFSMAHRQEVPPVLGAVHARFRTPYVAIAVNSAVVLGLGLYSSFSQAATIAAIVRLVLFLATCASLIVFRRRDREPIGFRVPGGRVVAAAGIVFCVWLLSTRSFAQAWMLLAIMAAGAVLWFVGRRGWFGVVGAS